MKNPLRFVYRNKFKDFIRYGHEIYPFFFVVTLWLYRALLL